MMNNTTNKITVSKTSPWQVFVDGEVYHTAISRSEARATAADLKKNGLPEHRQPTNDLPTAEALRTARRSKKVSTAALAAAAGITRYRIWLVETGRVEVTADYVADFDRGMALV